LNLAYEVCCTPERYRIVNAVDDDEGIPIQDGLFSKLTISILPTGVQDLEDGRGAVNGDCLAVRVLDGWVVILEESAPDKLDTLQVCC
jgi:hypothetical protein